MNLIITCIVFIESRRPKAKFNGGINCKIILSPKLSSLNVMISTNAINVVGANVIVKFGRISYEILNNDYYFKRIQVVP